MIGVISKKEENEIVKEFFQLFKTPWEFYDKKKSYPVVICTDNEIDTINTKLLIIFSSEKNNIDFRENITRQSQLLSGFIEYGNIKIPTYGKMSTFNAVGQSFVYVREKSYVTGLKIKKINQEIIRLGYDIFNEIFLLLSRGQPTKYASFPTIELHISMLRDIILDSGIPIVEIPPIPAGYKFIVCLTHDVDFIGIRYHKFDHTMWGFVYRATVRSFIDVLRRKASLDKLYKNWKAVLLLPFIYLGIYPDIWCQFKNYLEIEHNIPSTYYLIPFKNRVGDKVKSRIAKRRAAKYDINVIQGYVKKLIDLGYEIGVHGIDAWHNASMARQELDRIQQLTGQSKIGIRIHWLCFDNQTPQYLEKAGFTYDSTFGYNEVAGFRGGTSQVFKPIGVEKILELPMHVQDTALFSSERMNLSEDKAWILFIKYIYKVSEYGGVLTLIWHLRSLAPERLYGNFYRRILEELKSHNVWFSTASQVTEWFRKRRMLHFEKIQFSGNKLRLTLKNEGHNIQPQLILRLYSPTTLNDGITYSADRTKRYTDISLKDTETIELDLSISNSH